MMPLWQQKPTDFEKAVSPNSRYSDSLRPEQHSCKVPLGTIVGRQPTFTCDLGERTCKGAAWQICFGAMLLSLRPLSAAKLDQQANANIQLTERRKNPGDIEPLQWCRRKTLLFAIDADEIPVRSQIMSASTRLLWRRLQASIARKNSAQPVTGLSGLSRYLKLKASSADRILSLLR